MTHTPDLTAAAARVATLLRGVSDDQLDGPTPCPAYTVGDLVDHIGGLALAFTWAATKEFPPEAGQAPSGEAARLPDDWRDTFAERLSVMGEAWQDPAAWDGMTQAGGVDLPGQAAGCVAMDELVVHGWDLAVATGQPYDVDAASIEVALGFVGPVLRAGGGSAARRRVRPGRPRPGRRARPGPSDRSGRSRPFLVAGLTQPPANGGRTSTTSPAASGHLVETFTAYGPIGHEQRRDRQHAGEPVVARPHRDHRIEGLLHGASVGDRVLGRPAAARAAAQ